MVTEDYVSFETAKLLKEKGFDENTNCQYPVGGIHIGEVCEYNITDRSRNPEKYIPAPTLQMAMKWLRENYNTHIEVRYFPTPNIYRYVIIHSPATFENIDSHPQYFNTHEEACEEAIKYCLENLI